MNDFKLKPPKEFCMQTLQYELLQRFFVSFTEYIQCGGNKIINIGDK